MLELMANTVSARSQPQLALAVLPKALESARILKGTRGEASEIVESILERENQFSNAFSSAGLNAGTCPDIHRLSVPPALAGGSINSPRESLTIFTRD